MLDLAIGCPFRALGKIGCSTTIKFGKLLCRLFLLLLRITDLMLVC